MATRSGALSILLKAVAGLSCLLAAATVAAHFRSTKLDSSEHRAEWAMVNGHPMYYETVGAGRPLVLLHGGGDSVAGSFSQQLAVFSTSHRVVAPEQVGQGHTPDLAAPLSYRQMMEDTAALLQQLNVRDADVVGWSDGGIIALMLAAHRPELVRRVVVSGANIMPTGLASAELDAMRNMASSDGVDAASMKSKLNQLWLTSPTSAEISWELLARVQKPVLVMAGDHDVVRLEHTLDIYRALPQGQLYILPETSHRTFEERPQWVNPVILSFLAQT